jgi:hypothetical protein
MASNVTLPGTGVVIASDDIGGGLEVQWMKLDAGAVGASAPVNAANPLPVTVNDKYAITQTIVAVTATSTQLIAANANRKYLSWMVIGTADVTVTPGASAAVVGAGMMYQSSGANKQGASEEFPHGTPTNAFQCIAAATGSSIVVWEGA